MRQRVDLGVGLEASRRFLRELQLAVHHDSAANSDSVTEQSRFAFSDTYSDTYGDGATKSNTASSGYTIDRSSLLPMNHIMLCAADSST